jgi:hypothetical protein
MILQLASRHCRKIAGFCLFVFYLSIALPLGARSAPVNRTYYYGGSGFMPNKSGIAAPQTIVKKAAAELNAGATARNRGHAVNKNFIGGPSQPEMSTFKSVSADKLVNLFTGDFSYNIPLMDVGGYPINIYYDGGIAPEQEASWVGLGWNINPGNINRNMRGIPDDFNGEERLTVEQRMKPNRTWGANIGGDAEMFGIKLPVNIELGAEFNNYLGPSLDVGVRGSKTLFSISKYSGDEKFAAALGAKANWGIDINSRAGASFSGSVSLGAAAMEKGMALYSSAGVSTSYNSRSGIKGLTISEQAYFNQSHGDLVNESFNTNGIGGRNYTTITFAKPSYMPIIRMPITNTAWSARVQFGGGAFGAAADVEAEVYGQRSEIAEADYRQEKPMVGYLYYENAENHPEYLMDFTRFNDREVTPNTPIISVPQYTYDVFAIQGEGTGGSIRAYRYDFGYIRDNLTSSKDKNTSGGADVDPPGHFGANLQVIKTPSTTGEWKSGNKLHGITGFSTPKSAFGNFYFRNPGEATVSALGRYDNMGGTQLVRYKLGGTGQAPTIEPELMLFDAQSRPVTGTGSPNSVKLTGVNGSFTPGASRTQVVSFLNAHEAAEIGLDKYIKSYDTRNFIDNNNTIRYDSFPRYDGNIRKMHHISQINVTESDGKRYVYGIPVYNIVQKDLTFSVDKSYADIPDLVTLDDDKWASTGSQLLSSDATVDGYVQVSTTPAYAHSFLLSGILSHDYVDLTNNGITEDDLGTAIKFNYTKIQDGDKTLFKWRTPHTKDHTGNFNAGNRSEKKDDKAMISYGERESWYLQSVESKNMIAVFYLKDRADGKGALSEYGGIDENDHMLKALDKISLFSKADLVKNGLAKARPIKTVHFEYTYELCKNTPDNPGTTADKGKLTLTGISFVYNGQENKIAKSKYSFTYGDNPDYSFAAADRWGTYKPASQNPAGLKNSDYPYTIQDKTISGNNAGAWSLKTITLPSGGQIEVNYESDDYAYVQNKRAAVMMNVAGFGNSPVFKESTKKLYPLDNTSKAENNYVFIKVPDDCKKDAKKAYEMYLQGMPQLAFKIWVDMPKGPEYIPCYANFGNQENIDYGVDADNDNIIWVKMQPLGEKSPLSMTTLEYLRQQLPGQAFTGYDIEGEPPLKQVGDMLLGMVKSLRDAFTDPVNAFRKDAKAQFTDLSKCFVRLNAPKGYKYGGGYRVKSVILHDNWNAMTNQYAASYGQQYDYKTTETFNGATRTISSGVASYEPSIGGEENPWQSIVSIEDDMPLGPTSYGAVEMPVLDAFFPAPVVGYSNVTVTSIHAGTSLPKKSRSGIGRQVTEFYTAKDYPVSYSYTPFDGDGVKEFHQNATKEFLSKYAYDYKAQSQGFLVATNDMHGKMKSQASYSESDPATQVSYTENFYRNTGVNGLNEQFTFVDSRNNNVFTGNMGVDIELMTDTREFSVKGTSQDHQGNVDVFFLLAATIPIPTYWTINGTTENIYRAVTATKVINYHAVLDRVVVIDKGSTVETQNLAYDAETGRVVVNRTNNEFNRPVYNTTYPAYWAYSGMGPANNNIDGTYSKIDFVDGKVIGHPEIPFESGDELYITDPGSPTSCPVGSSPDTKLIWAVDRNKDNSSITSVTPDLVFIDGDGLIFNRTGVTFRIVRSGHRNMLEQSIATITSMDNPLTTGVLSFDNATKVINASAIEYKEKWQTDNDLFKRYRQELNLSICSEQLIEDPNGFLQKNINPYRAGLLGNFQSWRNMVFYDGRQEENFNVKTNIAENGFLKNFKPYWKKYTGYMLPDVQNKQWVWNSKLNRVNAKGLELETMNPLGIYTSAQYGFNKSTPVAITNNAQYNEMFAEGFEDYDYNESLGKIQYNSQAKRHIDFSNLGGSITNTDTKDFKAHSGKYVLEVQPNSTITKRIDVAGVPGYDFPMPYSSVTDKVLANPGGNFVMDSGDPDKSTWNCTFANVGNTIVLNSNSLPPPATSQVSLHYILHTDQYFKITSAGIYAIDAEWNIGSFDNQSTNVTSEISIYDENDTKLSTDNIIVADGRFLPVSITGSLSYCLKPGVYKMEVYYFFDCSFDCTNCPINISATTSFADKSLMGYKDVSTQNGCTYTIPFPETEVMQNPVYTAPPNKKMLLSAWVHETCGDAANGIPCKEYTYTHNQVQVKFQNNPGLNVPMNPAGPIIDGWQRMEGTFITPAAPDNMELDFVNSSGDKIYFDDIRIHPYNASMKSYVYDPVSLRLTAELDPNNYATFYEYDDEGTLIRQKIETKEGIKTVKETRSALQRSIK